MNKTFDAHMNDGTRRAVPRYAAFSETIQGEVFHFVVCGATDGSGKNLLHKESGKRVCGLAVGDEACARAALKAFIEEKGAAVVRSVLAAAS